MDAVDTKELIDSAKEFFDQAKYAQAETILNQLILKNCKNPIIFHMLGTIYYDGGKFNKAIRAFRRALEIDPGFTDASVGLSIILNDLGQYDDGKKVFEEAQRHLNSKNKGRDPYINEKLAFKHDELGELYFQYKRFNEALEQFFKALNLSSRRAEITMKIVECYIQLNSRKRARKELESLLETYPDFHTARLKLGKVLYDNNQAHLARTQWSDVLRRDPNNKEARNLLRQLDEGEGLVELNP